jgi:hypothetical protein
MHHLLEVAHSYKMHVKMRSDAQATGMMGMGMGIGIGKMALIPASPRGAGGGGTGMGMGGYEHSLRIGWRKFFSSCAVVSVFGSGGK